MVPPACGLEYRDLDTLANEFRLLTLSSTEKDSEEVCCSLGYVSLDDPPPYTALSYRWGDEEITRPIKINGHKKQVTENLEAALRELPRHDYKCLWVDALCINQADLTERGRQVLRMGEIYSKATETIAWLGVDADDSGKALQLVDVLAINPVKDGHNPLLDARDEALKWLKNDPISTKYEGHWTALLKLYQRSYWNRVWIIQEIVFAQNILVFCGSRHTTWENVAKATNVIVPEDQNIRTSVAVLRFRNATGMGNVLPLDALRGLTRDAAGRVSEYRSLLNVLTRSHESLASNRRDKIYALLTLSRDGRNLVPRPEYNISIEQLFIAITTAMIVANKDLDVICYGKSSAQPNLPSWVPNWGDKLPHTLVMDNQGHDLYNATGSLPGKPYKGTLAITEFVSDGLVLKARGFLFDIIDGLGAVEPSFEEDPQNPYHRLVQPTTILSRYGSEGGILHAIWHSLTLNRVGYQTVTHGNLNLISLTFEAAGRAELPQEFNVVLALWCRNNRSLKLYGRELIEWWRQWSTYGNVDSLDVEHIIRTLPAGHLTLLSTLQVVTSCKRLLTTEGGYIGMAPNAARKGDKVCLLLGCRVPVLLRERDQGRYELIGDVYVHGIMNGETLNKESYRKLQDFEIL